MAENRLLTELFVCPVVTSVGDLSDKRKRRFSPFFPLYKETWLSSSEAQVLMPRYKRFKSFFVFQKLAGKSPSHEFKSSWSSGRKLELS